MDNLSHCWYLSPRGLPSDYEGGVKAGKSASPYRRSLPVNVERSSEEDPCEETGQNMQPASSENARASSPDDQTHEDYSGNMANVTPLSPGINVMEF
jgi:hypothetical protein